MTDVFDFQLLHLYFCIFYLLSVNICMVSWWNDARENGLRYGARLALTNFHLVRVYFSLSVHYVRVPKHELGYWYT